MASAQQLQWQHSTVAALNATKGGVAALRRELEALQAHSPEELARLTDDGAVFERVTELMATLKAWLPLALSTASLEAGVR